MGLHQDSAGRSVVREQHFTLEDSLTPSFGFAQSFILLTDHYILGRALFILTALLNVGGLIAFRFLRVPPSRGPWFIGELIDGHRGVCFAFGVFIDGHFLEGSLTYVVGVFQAHSCYFLLQTYGVTAFFLSPVRTWALGLSVVLVYRAWTGPVPLFHDNSKSNSSS
ncbi:hypothetical protein GOODEAATRI_003477 [Goodea atripinnis]|uniref:Uncharacterized protein n=1 Tax=Goodea atripinnis TaxID=208336 RepID=A0ABV0PKH8_9TELE